ncbi:transposase family protein [Embleya sp. NPDC055664]
MSSANELAGVVFSGLASLLVEEVADRGEVIRVRARTPGGPVDCPDCGGRTGRMHAFHERTVTDVPIDGGRVVTVARFRRLVCPTSACLRITFREQIPGVLERYQRRTVRLLTQVRTVVRELAGRAGARTPKALGAGLSRCTALRIPAAIPLPPLRVPQVLLSFADRVDIGFTTSGQLLRGSR